jgi:hypothetical protein
VLLVRKMVIDCPIFHCINHENHGSSGLGGLVVSKNGGK